MFSLRKPTTSDINIFLQNQSSQAFSYPEVGASRTLENLSGYNIDCHRICLGQGAEIFTAACTALQKWTMFANGWTHLCWTDTPIKQGEVVAMLTKIFGLWWLNACRIVYVAEEIAPIKKFGFAYGTLPAHAECGEERFLVEWHPEDDTVWYEIAAFSHPRHWLVKWGYPLARRLQKRFVQDSMAAMKKAVASWERPQPAG